MKRKLIVTVLCTTAIAAPAFALFGLGDVVFDPTNFEEAVQQLAQMEQQYVQLVQTYEMVQNQYQQMLRMAQQLPAQVLAHYQTLGMPWVPSTSIDVYGNTAGWTSGINTGQGTAGGYSGASESLGNYGPSIGNIPADELPGVKTSYANVELADGANLSAMQTIGAMRENAVLVENAIQSLESDSLSSDPTLNTELSVLNKINAAGVIELRASQDTNKLLVAIAESQVIESKHQRDAEARAINQHISFMQNAQAAMAAQSANASQAMLVWRMP